MNEASLKRIEKVLLKAKIGRSLLLERWATFTLIGFVLSSMIIAILVQMHVDVAKTPKLLFLCSVGLGFVGVKTSKYLSHVEMLYGLLSDAKPQSIEEYKSMQKAASLGDKDFFESVDNWIFCERRFLKTASRSKSNVAKELFVGRSVG